MIEINLLPDELKVRIKKTERDALTKQVLYLIPIVIAILILCHLYFGLMLLTKNMQLNSLNAHLKSLEPQKKLIEDSRQELGLSARESGTAAALAAQRIVWSEKLNKLSINLPSGVWFTELDLTQKDLLIRGSVVSTVNEEMSLINRFIDTLKSDNAFMKDFVRLELNSVQRKNIGGYDTSDFIIDAVLKTK